MKKVILGMSAVALASMLWLHFSAELSAGESSEREYWYSSDPGVALLIVRFVGGMRPAVHRHTIYADGRYEYRLTDHTGLKISQQSELQLSIEEVTALLDKAVHAGLMEYDRERIKEQMLATQPPHYSADAGTIFLEINLERYRGPNKKDAMEVSHAMSLRAPYLEARIFPEIKEIQALAYIGRKVQENQRRAEANHAYAQ